MKGSVRPISDAGRSPEMKKINGNTDEFIRKVYFQWLHYEFILAKNGSFQDGRLAFVSITQCTISGEMSTF